MELTKDTALAKGQRNWQTTKDSAKNNEISKGQKDRKRTTGLGKDNMVELTERKGIVKGKWY